jgi:hypothetical protein
MFPFIKKPITWQVNRTANTVAFFARETAKTDSAGRRCLRYYASRVLINAKKKNEHGNYIIGAHGAEEMENAIGIIA